MKFSTQSIFPIWIMVLIAICSLVIIPSCSDDEEVFDRLNYDGPNNTSPFLPAGIYEAAAHYTASAVANYQGRTIQGIEYYAYSVPDEARLVIYASEGNNEPGRVLYSQDVRNDIQTNQWNQHTLTENLTVPDQGFWVSLRFEQSREQQVIGCDEGQRQGQGDWLKDEFEDNEWRSFQDRTSESINWNIRVLLD